MGCPGRSGYHAGPPGTEMALPPRTYHLPIARSRRLCGGGAIARKKSNSRFARQREDLALAYARLQVPYGDPIEKSSVAGGAAAQNSRLRYKQGSWPRFGECLGGAGRWAAAGGDCTVEFCVLALIPYRLNS